MGRGGILAPTFKNVPVPLVRADRLLRCNVRSRLLTRAVVILETNSNKNYS
jgi:hypothetical protein